MRKKKGKLKDSAETIQAPQVHEGEDIIIDGSIIEGRADIPNCINPNNNLSNYTTNNTITQYRLNKALSEYLATQKTLKRCIEDNGISFSAWIALRRKDISLTQFVRNLKREKSEMIREKASELYTDIEDFSSLPEYVQDIDNKGNAKVSMAGVKLLDNKYKALVESAKYLECGTTDDKQQAQNITNNVTAGQININIKQVMDTPIEDLQKLVWDE